MGGWGQLCGEGDRADEVQELAKLCLGGRARRPSPHLPVPELGPLHT